MATPSAGVQIEQKIKSQNNINSNGAELGHPEEAHGMNNTDGDRFVLRKWRIRFWDQFTALIRKQSLVYFRNLRSTLLRIFAPLFFMFLLWLLNLAFRADNIALDAFTNYPNPSVTPVGAIPACSSDAYINEPCYDLIFSPNTSSVAQQLINTIRTSNLDRVIPETAVLGFSTIAEADTFLIANPDRVLGGVHFLLDANANPPQLTGINYVLQVNSTTKFFKGRFQDPTFFSTVPIQVAVENAIAQYHWANTGKTQPLSWNVSYSQFAHPETSSINIVGQAMGPFVFAANMFNFVLLLSSVVSERERGLRQALTTAGMLDSAFWLSWLFVELLISVIFSLLLIGFGAMFGFAFFLKNAFSVVFTLFLLFQWAMVGAAFILSAFISKSGTAINMGFVIFLVGWIIQAAIAFNFPYTPDYIGSVPALTVIFTLIPSAPLAKAAIDLGNAAEISQDGISWSRRSPYCQNIKDNPSQADALYKTDPTGYWDFDCVFPVGTVISILALEFVVYTLLAIYLDNIFANENGVRKKPWYFLTPSYWSGGRRKGGRGLALKSPKVCPIDVGEVDVDVDAEEAAMRDLLVHRTSKSSESLAVRDGHAGEHALHAVEVFGLQKAFGRPWCGKGGCLRCGSSCCSSSSSSSSSSSCCCCNGGGSGSGGGSKTKEFWAIKGSWFGIPQGQLFCLLGPNGAGKTTTINCLTGVLPPTGGDALIYGESITSPGGLDRIRAIMGVCPQFDVLWGELTGIEHLLMYGRVKGLSRKEVLHQAEELLESVKLTDAATQRTASYSGGMRRRLSVAIALLGDPLIVYLDEPTTGMDPISRRHVWDAIEAAKPGRAIVLTTHSMEEADILGDNVAIMARGRLRAFGSSLRLKQRFGSGYELSVAVGGSGRTASSGRLENSAAAQSKVDALVRVFTEELEVAAPEQGSGQYIVFNIPKEKESALASFLRRLEVRASELSITDVQISLTSLEEVFLSIARKAELEAAVAEGRADTEVTLEDGSVLDVPLGEEIVVQESTGRRYAIKWAQDENGELQVLSWKLIEREEVAHQTMTR